VVVPVYRSKYPISQPVRWLRRAGPGPCVAHTARAVGFSCGWWRRVIRLRVRPHPPPPAEGLSVNRCQLDRLLSTFDRLVSLHPFFPPLFLVVSLFYSCFLGCIPLRKELVLNYTLCLSHSIMSDQQLVGQTDVIRTRDSNRLALVVVAHTLHDFSRRTFEKLLSIHSVI